MKTLAIAASAIGIWLAFRPHPLVGVRILPDLNIDEVACVELDGKPILSRRNGEWQIDAHGGYPADDGMVMEFLHSLTNLTVWKVEKDPKWIKNAQIYPLLLALRNAEGRELANLKIGYHKHGVGHSGLVESVFIPDGSFLHFQGEIVVVQELFKMFWGHDTPIYGFCVNKIDVVPELRGYEKGRPPPVHEITAIATADGDSVTLTKRYSRVNEGLYGTKEKDATYEIECLREGEVVDAEYASSLMAALKGIYFWDARRMSEFSKEKLAKAKKRIDYVVRSSDGESTYERSFTFYDCGKRCYVAKDGWVYSVHDFYCNQSVKPLSCSRTNLVHSTKK